MELTDDEIIALGVTFLCTISGNANADRTDSSKKNSTKNNLLSGYLYGGWIRPHRDLSTRRVIISNFPAMIKLHPDRVSKKSVSINKNKKGLTPAAKVHTHTDNDCIGRDSDESCKEGANGLQVFAAMVVAFVCPPDLIHQMLN